MKKVLFVCVHNAGRSQMAEALFNLVADGKAAAISAGTQPGKRVHPSVEKTMLELGIDLRGRKPRLLTQEMLDETDKVITMGCGVEEACPSALVEAEDWGLEDPKGQTLEKVRAIRDEIRAKISQLLQELA